MSQYDEIAPDAIGPNDTESQMKPLKHLDTVIALYDFPGTQTYHLPLNLGDTIYVLSKNNNGWWDGVIINNNEIMRGWFPNNYVRSVNYVQPVLNKLKSNKELDSITAANTAANVLIPSFTSLLQVNLLDSEKNSINSTRKNSVVSFASSDTNDSKSKSDSQLKNDSEENNNVSQEHSNIHKNIHNDSNFNSFSSNVTSIMDNDADKTEKDSNPDSNDHHIPSITNTSTSLEFKLTSPEEAESLVRDYKYIHNRTPTWISRPTSDGNLIYFCSQLDIFCETTPMMPFSDDDLEPNFEVPGLDILNDTLVLNNNDNELLLESDPSKNLNNFLKRDSNTSLSSNSSVSSIYHQFNQPLYCVDDFFYTTPTDITSWTDLNDNFDYLLDLSFKSIKDNNKQLFSKNFSRLNKIISIVASSIRLSQHDFKDTKYHKSIKRKFKRLCYNYSQIYINSILHLSMLHHSTNTNNSTGQLFSFDISQLNKSTSVSTNSIGSSISTINQLPITSIRKGSNDSKVENSNDTNDDNDLSYLDQIEREIDNLRNDMDSLIRIFLKITRDKNIHVSDYDGSDSDHNSDSEHNDNQEREAINRYNILPQNYPRFLSNEFNGGNWCNPFFETSNTILNASGNELKNRNHQKILIDRTSFNSIKNLTNEMSNLSKEALLLLSPEKQHLYYNKTLKDERNTAILRLTYKYLYFASSMVDLLESFDFTVFCLIKRYNSHEGDTEMVMNDLMKKDNAREDTDQGKQNDLPNFKTNLSFDYPVVLEFFHYKQSFHYLVSRIIMTTQSLTLEDPEVFKGMNEDENPLYYNRDLMKLPNQRATLLLKNLLIRQINSNKGHSISLNTDTLLARYLMDGDKFFEDILSIIKNLMEERETILNYATRVMHDDFNVQLLIIERNNTMASEKSDDFNNNFFTGKKSSTDVPWYLEGDDEFDLLLDMKGSIKGGTKEALVAHLTHHDLFDSNFNSSFLLTFASMMSINEFVNLLIMRFNIEAPEGLSYEEYNLWISKKQNPIRLRVLNIMKLLLEKYWSVSYFNEVLIQRWIAFLQNHSASFTIAKSIIISLNKLLKGETVMIEREPVVANTRTPAPLTRPSLVKKLKLLDIDYIELARQLTLKEFKLYSKINKFQCLTKVWGKKSGLNENFDNITNFIKASNQLTNFVTYMILRKQEPKKRVQIIRYFVQVAERCRQYNNFSSMTAIISALYSSPIHRLKKTWKFVSKDVLGCLQNMNKLMNSSRNFNEYRDVLKFIGTEPCVPFFGVYLSDLTFIYHGNPDTLLNRTRMINFSKRAKTSEILLGLDRFKSTSYNLLLVPEIQNYVDSWFERCPTIEEQYQLSLNLEPRENVQPSSNKSFPFSRN